MVKIDYALYPGKDFVPSQSKKECLISICIVKQNRTKYQPPKAPKATHKPYLLEFFLCSVSK